MIAAVIVMAIVALMAATMYYGSKVWIAYITKKRFENSLAEFTSDLYKLQNKWSSKGEYEFAEFASYIIKVANGYEDVDDSAKSAEGRRIQKELKNLN